MENKLPTCSDYAAFLHRIVIKEGIKIDQARNKYGLFTYSQWNELFK